VGCLQWDKGQDATPLVSLWEFPTTKCCRASYNVTEASVRETPGLKGAGVDASSSGLLTGSNLEPLGWELNPLP
jgi:hypothetical protein